MVKSLYTTATGGHEVTFRSLPPDARISIADSNYKDFRSAMGIITTEDQQPSKKS